MLFKAIALAVVAFAGSSLAYEVTSPSPSQGWTTSGPNIFKWQWASTDPSNFTVVLTNANISIMPFSDAVLATVVDTTLGQITCGPPTGGWPAGSGFRINLTPDDINIDTVIAQSDYFDIFDSTSTLSRLPTGTVPIPDPYATGASPTDNAPYQDGGSAVDAPFFSAARSVAGECPRVFTLVAGSFALLFLSSVI